MMGDSGELSSMPGIPLRPSFTNKHLDFEEMDFSGKGEPRILRYAKLQDYNLSGVKFDNCNLFKATIYKKFAVECQFHRGRSVWCGFFGHQIGRCKL